MEMSNICCLQGSNVAKIEVQVNTNTVFNSSKYSTYLLTRVLYFYTCVPSIVYNIKFTSYLLFRTFEGTLFTIYYCTLTIAHYTRLNCISKLNIEPFLKTRIVVSNKLLQSTMRLNQTIHCICHVMIHAL